MSNSNSNRFPVRFILDGKHLVGETRVQGTKCRVSNKGATPEPGQTWMCSFGFRPKDAPFRYVVAHEQVTDVAALCQEVAAQLPAPTTLVLGTTNHASALDPVVKAYIEQPKGSQRNGKSRRNRGERKQPVQGVGSSNAATGTQGTTAQATQPTTGERKQPAGGATSNGDRHQKGRKSRDNRGERNQHGQRLWASSGDTAVAPKRPAVTRCSPFSALARAKVLLAPAPKGRIEQSDLRFAFSQNRAQNDATATALRASMQLVIDGVAELDADPRLELAMTTMFAIGEKARPVAEALFEARKEKSRLEAEQKALNADRLRALGKRSKALKLAGDKADPSEKAAVEAIKADFAAKQAPITDALKAVKEKISGTKETNGLDYDLVREIGNWQWDRAGEHTTVESVLTAMSDAEDIYDDLQAMLATLVGLVYDYDRRLNQLG